MSRCAVQIELDTTEPPRAGGRLRGTVHIEAGSPVPSKCVLLELRWRVRGQGNPGSLVVHHVTLHEGPLPGSTDLPFDIPLPLGPVSFCGTLMQLDWSVCARVDIDWAIDPTGECAFVLRPGPPTDQPYVHGSTDLVLGPDSINNREIRFGVAGWILACAGLFIGLPCVVHGISKREWPLVFFGSIFLAIPIGAMIHGWRLPRRLAERRLGPVQAEVRPLLPVQGQQVFIRLSTTPPAPVGIEGATATLLGVERVTRGTGKNRRTTTRPFHQSAVALASPTNGTLPGSSLVWHGSVTLPHDALPSFTETDNHVIWTIELKIRVAGGLDWTDTVTLGIVPVPASA